MPNTGNKVTELAVAKGGTFGPVFCGKGLSGQIALVPNGRGAILTGRPRPYALNEAASDPRDRPSRGS